MNADIGVGALVDELKERGDRLPFEIGAFVALEACEDLLQHAVLLDADDVRVTADGSVVVASSKSAEADEAAKSLISVLARLLTAAGPGVPPYLLDLIAEGPDTHKTLDLRTLHDAIEASLIPLNRSASRRVLARLVRETDQPPAMPKSTIDPRELDAELDELLRESRPKVEPEPEPEPKAEAKAPEPPRQSTPAPDPSLDAEPELAPEPEPAPEPAPKPELAPEPEPAPRIAAVVNPEPGPTNPTPVSTAQTAAAALAADAVPDPVTATIRVRFPEEEPGTAKIRTQPKPSASAPTSIGSGEAPPSHAALDLDDLPTETGLPSPAPEAREPSLVPRQATEATPTRARRSASLVPWLLVLGAALGLGAFLSRDLWQGAPATSPAPSPTTPVARAGAIEVSVFPEDAQIFLFIGRGPAVDDGLAVSAPHEFVVFDTGLQPTRAVVPAGTSWPVDAQGPLYELAVQAPPTTPEPAAVLELGIAQTQPSADAGSAPDGRGRVRVITNPPGAKVYRFIGIGPEATLDVSSVDEGYEVLVYHPDHSARRAVIGPSDWRADTATPGRQVASVEVALPPLPSAEVPEPGDD